jgi:hypothetical protein
VRQIGKRLNPLPHRNQRSSPAQAPVTQAQPGIVLSLEIIKDQLAPISLQLFVTRTRKLFKILSDRSTLQATMFRIFSLKNGASA